MLIVRVSWEFIFIIREFVIKCYCLFSDLALFSWFKEVVIFEQIDVFMAQRELIDTHCHLYLEEFRPDLADLVLRAEQEGVTKIYLPAIDSLHMDSLLQLEALYPGKCLAMTGLHPCYVNENYVSELHVVEQWLMKRKFAAVGEIGLDYYWSREYDKEQMIAFERQIGWALQYQAPIVIHSRNSTDECIEIVSRYHKEGLKGIFHCFSGNTEQAEKIMALGFMLGIGGVITYKNSGLPEVVSAVPLEYIVLETDAPYLSPAPFRGKRNESSYLKYVLKKVAEVKGVGEDEVARITTANAEKVFGG